MSNTGTCPLCHRKFKLNSDGTLHGHGDWCQGQLLFPREDPHGPHTTAQMQGCQCHTCLDPQQEIF